MGLWPFASGKKQRTAGPEAPGQETLSRDPSTAQMARGEKAGSGVPTLTRSSSKSRRDGAVRKLSQSRTPTSTRPTKSHTAPVASTSRKGIYRHEPQSQSSLGPDNFTVQRLPTLHAKRAEYNPNLPRHKTSKRKAEDYAREREIRAMSSAPIPIPKRPANFQDSGPLRRDTKQIPGSLNRKLERPMSEVSLPLPSSLPDVENMPNQNSFRVGILAALSPRPVVRYDSSSRLATGKSSIRTNAAIQKAIAEEDVSDLKRIEELADDLDSGGLRQLMDRDRRYREQKKEADRLKMLRKLQRRADRQREEEARRARVEAFVRESTHDSGNAIGLDIDSQSHPFSSDRPRADPRDPFADDAGPSQAYSPDAIPNPFEDERDPDIMDETDYYDEPDIPIPARSPLRQSIAEDTLHRHSLSHGAASPPLSPVSRAGNRSSLSQASISVTGHDSGLNTEQKEKVQRRVSERTAERLNTWTTFFKRGTRRGYTRPSHGRGVAPSEFSNTSRESFQRGQKAPSVASIRSFRPAESPAPTRTSSKFREELTEMPLSPPDSRLQSPEAADEIVSRADVGGLEIPAVIKENEAESEDPVLAGISDIAVTPRDESVPVVPQSLASVDSEGSWLSGKPAKRFSGPGSLTDIVRRSQSSLHRSVVDARASNSEEGGGRGPPVPDSPEMPAHQAVLSRKQQRASAMTAHDGEHSADSELDSDPDGETWHTGIGQQATVIRQIGRAKSREVLVGSSKGKAARNAPFSEAEGEGEGDDETQDIESPAAVEIMDAPLLRAKSVDYKGHVRAMSAGSAKLLEIKRSSTHSDVSRPRSPTLGRKSALSMADDAAVVSEPGSGKP